MTVDRAQYKKLVRVLPKIDMDNKDVRIIRNLYWNQETYVMVERSELEAEVIQTGVRLDGVLSPIPI